MRLDKLLAHTGYGTRKEVKQIITNGWVDINGQTVKKVGFQVDIENDVVTVDGQVVQYQKYHYYIMNKPEGIISATEDHYHETVIDWLGPDYAHLDLFPVGRLDIDTTGLLLLTNNGQLAHQLLSPKREVPKRYFAVVSGIVEEKDIDKFAKGLDLGDFVTQPSQLTILNVDEAKNQSRIEVVIHEGKFHQVKRMCEKINCEVIQLQRLSMGPLILPDDLPIGEYRPLNEDEWTLLEDFGIE
ncbi:pseudouridine synthase [Globicatella sanguinis]|uniref:pseudouridine synthase n=1 Tax=Globicatella sanguinis TaxID=13076 RepID=UPI002543F6E3|nr:pseudouridine synthase [Globicatella sanguinis]MDK7631431.1 pseudouridine synthase [Globicatella sanguinis]WIK67237.1 pseudouridine synthase [Globicatella sanguinis]WKT56642.1 pseudouridine synthase [Globicatella sanguinis]